MTDSNLVAFLNARLDEDADPHAYLHGGHDVPPHFPDCDTMVARGTDYPNGPCDCGLPERWAREVEAKRKIMDGHDRNESSLDAYCNCQVRDGMIYGKWPCPDLAALAAVWSDHPDYDPAWA